MANSRYSLRVKAINDLSGLGWTTSQLAKLFAVQARTVQRDRQTVREAREELEPDAEPKRERDLARAS